MIYCTTWDNIADVRELYKEWAGNYPLDTWKNSILVVAKDNDKIVGGAQLIVISDPIWARNWGLIENVYVLKEYRSHGAGEKLMKVLESQASFLGCKFIKLTSRKDEGKRLYRSLGYEEGSSFRKEL